MKFRGYEHGFIPHKELKTNLSLKTEIEEIELEEEPQLRRSNRLQNKERVNYRKMDKGENTYMDKETTLEVAEHMAGSPHENEDMECIILGYEENWWKRGVKEAIDIKIHRPSLNKDGGRYNLAPIWNKVILKSLKQKSKNLIGRKTVGQAGRSSNNFTTEEDQPIGGRN